MYDNETHLIAYIAKKQILQDWVSVDTMLLLRWKGSLMRLMYMDKLHTKIHEARVTSFFKKRHTLIEAFLSESEIHNLMTKFQFTTWYAQGLNVR